MTVELRKDSSFLFRSWSDILGADTLPGIWRVHKDTITLIPLNANPASEFVPLLREDSTQNFKSRIVRYIGTAKLFPGVRVYAAGEKIASGFLGIADSLLIPDEISIDSILIDILYFERRLIPVNGKAQLFEIFTESNLSSMNTLNLPQIWLRRKGRIISATNDSHNLILVKTKKSW
ncbi:MAG: hypothetical protein R3C61_18110 [Bacteroidia bacterium]